MTLPPAAVDESDAVTLMCYYCLQPMVWDDTQQQLWCPACRYAMPNG